MPVDESVSPSLEIAHVLFMDVVGYSKLPMDHQQSVLSHLMEAVRRSPHFMRAHKNGQLISLPTGDGMALVFFGDPEAPVRCAMELSHELRAHPDVQLRMGVHTGPVYRIADINANRNVSGGGINIAQRIGLNPEIVADARAKLTSQAQDVGRFLDRLHSDLREIDNERVQIRRQEQELALERSHLAAEGKKEQREKIRELEKKLESVLRDFEYRARETVNAVQDRAQALKLSKDAERRIAKMRREFREQFDSTVVAHSTGADQGDHRAAPHVIQQVSVGDMVRLKSLGRDGKVLRQLDDDSFEIAVGPMKMKVARDDIADVVVRVGGDPVSAARARGINVALAREDESVPTEINVIGQNVDDASRAVEKFVDRAFLAGAIRLRVVHGSGMGILRKALRQLLQSHPHVATVSEPPQNEGGAGATVVELRT